MQHATGGIRRVDLEDETLLLDGDGGRVVRLRGPARAAIDGADTPEARAAIGHLAGLGVLDGDAGSFAGVTSDVTRRDVLSVSAAAALGVTVMALPTAAAAVSLGGSSTQRTGFVQVGEISTVGVEPTTVEITSITRSFTHDGRIHLLDLSLWKLYIFSATLEPAGTRAVDLSTVVPKVAVDEGGTATYDHWSRSRYRATDFVLDSGHAYIATTYYSPYPTPFVQVVRLQLPIAADVTTVGAVTLWTTSLANGGAGGRSTKNLLNRSWHFPDAEVAQEWGDTDVERRTIPGTDLVTSDGSAISTAERFDNVSDLDGLVLVGENLYGVVRFFPTDRSSGYQVSRDRGVDEFGNSQGALNRGSFYITFWELIRIPTTGPGVGVAVVRELGDTATWFPDVLNAPEAIADDSLNLDETTSLAAIVAGTRPAFIGIASVVDDDDDGNRVALLVANPSSETPTATVKKSLWPGYFTDWDGLPFSVQVGNDLFVAASADDSEADSGLIRVDLSNDTMSVTAFHSIPGAYDTSGPVATDGTFVFVVFFGEIEGEEGRGVARFLIGESNALTYQDAAIIGTGSFSDAHEPFTAQPWGSGISGVLTAARSGPIPVATFRFVESQA